MDGLARNAEFQDRLKAVTWDLIVVTKRIKCSRPFGAILVNDGDSS